MKYCLLVGVVAALFGCGGGGSPAIPTPNVVEPQAFSIAPATLTAGGQVSISEHSGASVGENSVMLNFDITFDKYFQCVADGHVGVMLHADLAQIPTGKYRGQGIIFAKFPTDVVGLPAGIPTAALESWWVEAMPVGGHLVIGSTASEPLHDGTYHVLVKSYVASDGKHLGYRITDMNNAVVGEFDYLDPNTLVDMSLDSMVIFDATATTPACGYSVKFDNMKAIWK